MEVPVRVTSICPITQQLLGVCLCLDLLGQVYLLDDAALIHSQVFGSLLPIFMLI